MRHVGVTSALFLRNKYRHTYCGQLPEHVDNDVNLIFVDGFISVNS